MKSIFAKPYPKMGTKGTDKPAKPSGGTKKPKRSLDGGILFVLAIIKTAGTGVVGISGKIAGTVFTSGGQQGAFARVWAKPRNRRTVGQTFVRGLLSGISSSWRTLTGAQVDAWNASAADDNPNSLRRNVFGDIRRLSGSQLFQRVNNIVQIIGGSVYSDPPNAAATDQIIGMSGAASAGGTSFDLQIDTYTGATSVPANTTVVVYATAQKGSGRSYFGKSQYRLLATYPAATAINPLDIYADYVAKFGLLNVGSRIGVYAHFVLQDGTDFGKGGDVYATVTVAA